MNFAEWAKSEMMRCGMFESDADYVVNKIVNDPEFAAGTMKGRWSHDSSDYPPLGLTMMFNGFVKPVALERVEETCPGAWFKPVLFDEEQRAEFEAKGPIFQKWKQAQQAPFKASNT